MWYIVALVSQCNIIYSINEPYAISISVFQIKEKMKQFITTFYLVIS